MLWNEVIELVSEITLENDMGDTITQPIFREVFANKKGIRQSEFYQAQATGLKPEIMFEISIFDYDGEKKVRVDKEKMYNIIRTFPTKNERLELICQGVVNHGNT